MYVMSNIQLPYISNLPISNIYIYIYIYIFVYIYFYIYIYIFAYIYFYIYIYIYIYIYLTRPVGTTCPCWTYPTRRNGRHPIRSDSPLRAERSMENLRGSNLVDLRGTGESPTGPCG